jgi:hypothetical protein
MKIITRLLIVLLLVLTTACTKGYTKTNISCPDPVIKDIKITDDKSILDALNLTTEAFIAEKAQVECYKKALK